jgi:DNA-binding transcriptional LysR family regulator
MIGGAERIEVKSAVIGDHPQVIIAPQRSISPREIAKKTILMREVGSGTRLLAERFLAPTWHRAPHRHGEGSNETIKQAVMAGLGIAFISAHTIAAEISDARLAILDVAGLPEIRQWFVVRPAAKRMMPAARSLRDFLVAEGRSFLPNLKHGRGGGKTPRARGNHSAKRK